MQCAFLNHLANVNGETFTARQSLALSYWFISLALSHGFIIEQISIFGIKRFEEEEFERFAWRHYGYSNDLISIFLGGRRVATIIHLRPRDFHYVFCDEDLFSDERRLFSSLDADLRIPLGYLVCLGPRNGILFLSVLRLRSCWC